MTFSEKLAYAMQQAKISTRTLSEMTGIPKSAIQRYTSGETEKIPIDRMKKMAEALSIDPAYVMGWTESSFVHPAPEPISCSDPIESELITIYRDLSTEGQKVLMGTARSLATNPDYRKDSPLNDATMA